MTGYTAHSAHGSGSTTRAHIIGSWVHVTSKERHWSASTAMAPDVARTFARGILALADEIDGGEAKEAPADTRPKVGDRVMIVRNGYSAEGDENVGRVGVVAETDYADELGTYRVSLPNDDYGWWCAEVELVDEPAGLIDKEGLADWERDLLTKPSTALAVGTRVRVLEASYIPAATGMLGTVYAATDQRGRLRVQMDGEVGTVDNKLYADRWEVVDEPKPSPSSPFARYVEEAKRLLTGTDHRGADVIVLARELHEQS